MLIAIPSAGRREVGKLPWKCGGGWWNRMLSHVQLFGVLGILFGFNFWSDYGGWEGNYEKLHEITAYKIWKLKNWIYGELRRKKDTQVVTIVLCYMFGMFEQEIPSWESKVTPPMPPRKLGLGIIKIHHHSPLIRPESRALFQRGPAIGLDPLRYVRVLVYPMNKMGGWYIPGGFSFAGFLVAINRRKQYRT